VDTLALPRNSADEKISDQATATPSATAFGARGHSSIPDGLGAASPGAIGDALALAS